VNKVVDELGHDKKLIKTQNMTSAYDKEQPNNRIVNAYSKLNSIG
jgi:hypothetical protein